MKQLLFYICLLFVGLTAFSCGMAPPEESHNDNTEITVEVVNDYESLVSVDFQTTLKVDEIQTMNEKFSFEDYSDFANESISNLNQNYRHIDPGETTVSTGYVLTASEGNFALARSNLDPGLVKRVEVSTNKISAFQSGNDYSTITELIPYN